MTEAELAEIEGQLSDPLWRLTSGKLYRIKTADGQGLIPFTPRPEQVALLRQLLDAVAGVKSGAEVQRQFVRLKSRRLGFSTAIGVFVADCLGFRKSFTAALIDQTGDDSSKKMNGIVKVALASLREVWPLKVIKDNDSELTVDVAEECDGSGPSTFYAGTKMRGGSVDFLWCSELGVIQFEDEPRAEEIVTGAFPSARHGVICVETTWKGGKGGKLWDVIQPTLDGVAADWRVDFTPWYVDPRNVSETAAHDAESLAYFAKIAPRLQSAGIALSDAQRRWWAAERRTQGIFMRRENPTFLDECWTAPIEGAVYAEAIEQARAEGRVSVFPVDGNALVNTSWDLGAPANTVVWYWQAIGREIRIVDVDQGFEGTLVQRVAAMQAKGYPLGTHFVPHDALQTSRSGTTFLTELSALLPNIVTVPKCYTEWIGINHLLQMFGSLAFRATPEVLAALDTLACYHTRKSGLQAGELVHDWSSHCFVGETKVWTQYGLCPIMELPCKGLILSPKGWVPYRNPRITRKNAQLVEVRFKDGLMVKCTPDHLFRTESGWKSACSLQKDSRILSISTPSLSISEAGCIACGKASITSRVEGSGFTGTFGRLLLGRFQRAAIFIIEMAMRSIIGLRIWNACPQPNTSTGTQRDTMPGKNQAPKRWLRLRSGISQRPEGCGISSKPNDHSRGRNGSASRDLACTAERNLTVWCEQTAINKSIVGTPARPCIIESVRPVSFREDVWCLTVPRVEAFCLQNGAVVHNCADALRTMAEAHRAELFKFKHTAATPRPDWYDPDGKRQRRGIKPRTVSGLRV